MENSQEEWCVMNKTILPAADEALPGRDQPMPVSGTHIVLQTPIKPPFPERCEVIYLGLGCFWGAERLFWSLQGIYTTAVGYQGGFTPNPTYEEVCSGRTGHAEMVMVAFNPDEISLNEILAVFWESHDPTQGMRQGNDIGTQYRSAIYTTKARQTETVLTSCQQYNARLKQNGHQKITTEIRPAGPFYYAEEWHQQYLAKNPGGYCGLKGTGVCLAG